MTDDNIIIKQLLTNVDRELANKTIIDYGLLGGDLGKIIFIYSAQRKLGLSTQSTNKLIERMLESLSKNPLQLSYCNGYAGMCLGLRWLDSMGYIDLDTKTISSLIPILCESIKYYLYHDNIDYLHGAIGVARYLLSQYNSSELVKDTITFTVDWLNNHMLCDTQGGGYWLFTSKENKTYQNISLSHGLSSIALFLCKAYSLISQDKRKVYNMLKKLSIHLTSHIVDPKLYGSYTLSSPINDPNKKYMSRLAWCYGDLGFAIALLEIGKCLGEQQIIDLSNEIIIYSSEKRLNPIVNSVRDAGLCHGAFGIALIYRYF